MGQGKYDFDYVAPDPNRTEIEPLRDGIGVGKIRTRPKKREFCECDEPEERNTNAVRIYQYVEGTGVVELRACKLCGLIIKLNEERNNATS